FNEGFALVEKDGKWGYINTKGEQIVECKFDGARDFHEGFADVKKDGKWGYINTKGEQIIERKFDDAYGFNEGFALVEKDGKYGYINTKGYPVIFDKSKNEIEVFDKVIDRSNNTFYLSRLGDKFGLLDENFNVIIKNSIYGKFEVLQRINETTFLIKIAERDIFVDSEGNFR
ncbi:MAG: WG repeat-containing protein, partial [Campylobacter concisus]|nr:WG repeat-containing protein [Campylobacter concisus]